MSETSINSYIFYKPLHQESPCLSHSCLCDLLPCSTGTGFLKLTPAAAALIALSGDSPLTKYRGKTHMSSECLKFNGLQISNTLFSSPATMSRPRGSCLAYTQPDLEFFKMLICAFYLFIPWLPWVFICVGIIDTSGYYSSKGWDSPHIAVYQPPDLQHRCAELSRG